MAEQRRRKEDICDIARKDAEQKLKGLLTVYSNLFPVPLKGMVIRFDEGITIEYLLKEKKL